MDTEQVLKVTVNALNVWSGWESFYARMGKDGRITISEVDAGTAARQRTESHRLRYGSGA
jgi:hypothetical protein